MITMLGEYSKNLTESAQNTRMLERAAFEKGVNLLRRCEGDLKSDDAITGLRHIEKLWMLLMEDLANDGNRSPDDLKARLISIGIWVLKEVVAIRMEMKDSVQDLIEINEIIAAGL